MSSCLDAVSFPISPFFTVLVEAKVSSLFYLIPQVVKVADFGVARVKAQTGVMTAETGTYRWMAPEVFFLYNIMSLYLISI